MLVFCLGITLWSFLRQYTHEEIRYVSVKDTVYIAAKTVDTISPEKVHDTVYIKVGSARPAAAQATRYESPHRDKNIRNTVRAIPGDINILKLRDKDEPYNSNKGNSREDDTLLKQYPFVQL